MLKSWWLDGAVGPANTAKLNVSGGGSSCGLMFDGASVGKMRHTDKGDAGYAIGKDGKGARLRTCSGSEFQTR